MSKVIYISPLSGPDDIKDFIIEGQAVTAFNDKCMRLEGGPISDAVIWCPKVFPADLKIEWEFRPISADGYSEVFFAVKAASRGADMFGSDMAKRDGIYSRYHSGDINALHVSYYRRSTPDERAFHTCELRKSCGYHLVAEGADPIPDITGDRWYRMCIIKKKTQAALFINELKILEFDDDGRTYGDLLTGGCIGFRQAADTAAQYRNLKVTWI